VNLYPSQVETVLAGIAELAPHYQIEVTRDSSLDDITVHVEVRAEVHQTISEGSSTDGSNLYAKLGERVQFVLRDTLGLSFNVQLAAPGTVPRSEGGKLRRVVDRRSLG
jgi:phenylacetate-CoA ligase